MIGVPLVGVLSRRALPVLLPVGLAILTAGYLLSVSRVGLRALRAALLSPIGCAGLFLAGWAMLSLFWTPFPERAAPGLAASIVTLMAAVSVIALLPERRARAYLYLLPGGVAATAAATIVLALRNSAAFRGGTEFDPSLLERSLLTLSMLLWPALGALVAFARWRIAATLASLVALTLFAADARIAMAVFAAAAAAFVAAASRPRDTSRALAIAVAILVAAAPALPFALAPLARAVSPVGASTVAAMMDWRGVIAVDLPRLLTGHGIDGARIEAAFGYLPPHTPRTILFEIWYDLGVLGALALATLFALALRAAGEAAAHVAPPLIGGLVTTLTITLFGLATTQLWFVTLVSLQAVAFGLLARASRNDRPAVAASSQAEQGSRRAARRGQG